MKRSSNEKIHVKPYKSKRTREKETTEEICSGLNEEGDAISSRCTSLNYTANTSSSHCSSLADADDTNTKLLSVLCKVNSFYQPSKIYHKLSKSIIDHSREHKNVVPTIKWKPFSETLFATVGYDKSIILWDAAYKKLQVVKRFLYHQEAIKDFTWNHDGGKLLTASFDKTSKVVDIETGAVVNTLILDDMVTTALFKTADENICLTGTFKTGVVAWDCRQNKVVQRYKSYFGQVHDLLFLQNDEIFLSCAEIVKKNSMDKAILAWDFKTSAVLPYQIYQEPHTITRLKMDPLENRFYAQSSAGYVAIFDSSSPWKMNKYKRFEGHQCTGYRVGFDMSSDGRYLYSGDTDGHIVAYNAYTSEILKKLRISPSPCIDISCSRSHESMVICSSWDGQVTLMK